MSELARASAPAPTVDVAILHQLQIITEQLTTVHNRLDALEKASSRSLGRTAQDVVPAGLFQDLHPLLLPTAAVGVPVLLLPLLLLTARRTHREQRASAAAQLQGPIEQRRDSPHAQPQQQSDPRILATLGHPAQLSI